MYRAHNQGDVSMKSVTVSFHEEMMAYVEKMMTDYCGGDISEASTRALRAYIALAMSKDSRVKKSLYAEIEEQSEAFSRMMSEDSTVDKEAMRKIRFSAPDEEMDAIQALCKNTKVALTDIFTRGLFLLCGIETLTEQNLYATLTMDDGTRIFIRSFLDPEFEPPHTFN